MKARVSIAAVAAALSIPLAGAHAAPSALARACAADIKQFCADVKAGGGALTACVEHHFSDLSIDCQIAYVKAAAVGRACKADMMQFCDDVKAGKAECLKSHAADLSGGCKEAWRRRLTVQRVRRRRERWFGKDKPQRADQPRQSYRWSNRAARSPSR
jgi:hypothetical protein